MIKKYIVNFLIFFFIISFVTAKEYNEYDVIKLFQFKTGSGNNQLAAITGNVGSYVGPEGPSMSFHGDTLLIADALNWRILELNKLFQFSKIIEVDSQLSYGSIEKIGNSFFSYNVWERFTAFDATGKALYDFWDQNRKDYIFRNSSSKLKTFFYFDDLIILEEKESGRIISIENATSDKTREKLNVKSIDEIKQLLKDKFKAIDSNSEISVDSKNRFFVNNKLSTLDYKTFYDYWLEQHTQNKESPPYTLNFSVQADYFLRNLPDFIATDTKGNVYWAIDNNEVIEAVS